MNMKSLNQLTSSEHKLLVALNRGDSNKRIAADYHSANS